MAGLDRPCDGRQDALLKASPRRPVLVPPGEVVVRQSTDVLAVQDPALEKALRFIRDQLHRSLGVAELAWAAAVSRRVLERKFRAVVGHSPLREIHRLRLDRAARLLAETALPVTEIAERCGFTTLQMLESAFRRAHGLTPRRYRLLHADTATVTAAPGSTGRSDGE